jgi:hypothetical protein
MERKMTRVSAVIASGFVLASLAFAQSTPPAQDICTMGFEKAEKGGMLTKLSKDTVTKADTNKDGKISKSEYDQACEKKLFMPSQKN